MKLSMCFKRLIETSRAYKRAYTLSIKSHFLTSFAFEVDCFESHFMTLEQQTNQKQLCNVYTVGTLSDCKEERELKPAFSVFVSCSNLASFDVIRKSIGAV